MTLKTIIDNLQTKIQTAIDASEFTCLGHVYKHLAEYPDKVDYTDYPFVGVSASDEPVIDTELDPSTEESQIRKFHVKFGIWAAAAAVDSAAETALNAESEFRDFLRKEENRITSDGMDYAIGSTFTERYDQESNMRVAGIIIVCEYRQYETRPFEY